MPELPKEELDKVFREGADRYDFPFKPEAWEHMESLLHRDRRRRFILWWSLGVLGLIVLFSGLGFFLFRAEGPKGPAASEQILKHSIQDQSAGQQPAEMENIADSPDPRLIPDHQGGQELGEHQQPNLPSAPRVPVTPSIPETKTATNLPDKSSDPPPNKSFRDPDPSFAGKENQPGITTHRVRETNEAAEPKLPDRPIVWHPGSLPVISPEIPLPPIDPELRLLPAAGSGPEPESPEGQKNKLVFALLASPELVSVGFDDFSRLGIKFGVQLEYLYWKRLGLSAGLNFLRKNYLAGKGEYHPPYGFWTRKIAPITTDGHCNILEVPVMLTYFTRGYRRPGFYASFGASSYIMLNESYYYSYDVPDPDLIRDWSSNEVSRHWMSLINYSLGYSGTFSKKLGFRLGVYGQTPLNGVGHGQVKLHSLGLNFLLIFSPPQ